MGCGTRLGIQLRRFSSAARAVAASAGVGLLRGLVHLATAPGKQMQVFQRALRKTLRLWHYGRPARGRRGRQATHWASAHDKRFLADAWCAWPHNNVIHQAFLLQQQVVAQRYNRRARRHPAALAPSRVRHALGPPCALPANFVLTNLSCYRGRTPKPDRT
jgi:polyhydroxyalkanoate synthase